MPKRIAWFCHRYDPCIGGSENFVKAMATRASAAGAEVTVHTSNALDLAYFVSSKSGKLDAPREETREGVRVRRLSVAHVRGQRYLGKLASFLPDWRIQSQYASYMPILPELRSIDETFDAVFAVGFPYTVFALQALRTARRSGAPLFLVPFLHLATPGDVVNKAYTKPHQIRLLREADGIISPTEVEVRALCQWGIAREKILRLPMATRDR